MEEVAQSTTSKSACMNHE